MECCESRTRHTSTDEMAIPIPAKMPKSGGANPSRRAEFLAPKDPDGMGVSGVLVALAVAEVPAT
jgi:hypothetical protein